MNNIENQSTIDYEYQIDPSGAVLDGTADSNITSTALVIGELTMTKAVDKAYATIGDILNYTITLNNNGNILLSDIVVTDIIAAGATFVTGSVIVDGTPQPTYNPNSGFNVGSLLILGSRTITFQAEVTTLPNPNTIANQATSTFNYLVLVPISGSSASNTVTTTININELEIVKSANVTAVEAGDTLTYTSVITNNGNIDAVDIIFTDIIPAEVTFVTGSVTVDGDSEPTFNPNTGFNIGTLAAGDSITVVFDTTVD